MNILELLTMVIASVSPQAERPESSLEITPPQQMLVLSGQERFDYNAIITELIIEDKELKKKKGIRINNNQQNTTIKIIKSII